LLDSPRLLLLVCSATTDDGRDRCRKPEPQWQRVQAQPARLRGRSLAIRELVKDLIGDGALDDVEARLEWEGRGYLARGRLRDHHRALVGRQSWLHRGGTHSLFFRACKEGGEDHEHAAYPGADRDGLAKGQVAHDARKERLERSEWLCLRGRDGAHRFELD